MQATLSSGSHFSTRLHRPAVAVPRPLPMDSYVKRPSIGLAAGDIDALAQACLQDQRSAMAVVESWIGLGIELEVIYLRGIAPVCRVLGKWWQDDRLDFASVTLATCRLQGLLYEFSPFFLEHAKQNTNGYSTLMLRPNSAQHSIGSFMLGEFFKRSGWAVTQLAFQSDTQIRRLLHGEWIDVVGYSLCSEDCLGLAAPLFSKIRRYSVNQGVKIMVGGPLVSANPAIAEAVGADLIGGDAQESQRLAFQCVTAQCKR